MRNNIGFTLTELIVTLAVSAVLLSVAVAGIVAWVHHADFVRNENYAETIYYAAQSELTRYRGNGQLAELADYVTKNDLKVPVEEIAPEIGVDYKDRLYYLKKDAGAVGENDPLGKWLSDYIYDGSIMEGAICIEFDPMDGTVYSVSYSDRNVGFTYDEENTAGEKVSLLKRAENIREKDRWGYYSVELSEAAPSAVGKTRVDRIELVNAEQLYLRWSLPQRYREIRGFLSYTIEIYEKAQTTGEADELKYTFTVKGSELKEKGSEDSITQNIGQYIITCKDAGPDNKGDFDFIAYMDESGEMYLVLDSIDYGVDPEKLGEITPFNTDVFRNSASVLQLFAEPEDIYVKLQASGKLYKASAKKQSNTSNTMFASMKETGTEYAYEIKNARHLYNIRYREWENGQVADASKLYYRQIADIVWLSDDEKLFHSTGTSEIKMNALQDTDKCIPADGTAAVPYFPAIPLLMGNSTLEVPGSRAYELMNFVLYQRNPAENGTEELAAGETGKLGIIAENKGIIQKLTVTDMRAQGYENVGAVCGVNKDEGKVWNTTVSGKVTGTENVGGLVGLDKTTSGVSASPDLDVSAYKNLTNYAEVTGTGGKIGGIVGTLSEDGQVYLCENYGAVKGTETCTVYIGGISGYNKGLVQNCLSAPDDAPARKDNGELQQAALKGIFVGGIVGCNDGGVIKNSGTEKESKNLTGKRSDSYIIGYRYVGGIVGYNNGRTDSGEDRTTVGTLVNTDSGKTNKANVVGHDYVGGIVGANGRIKDSVNIVENIKSLTPEQKKWFEKCEIEENYSDRILVQGWTNEGLVEAVGSYDSENVYDAEGFYAGGIAGYNAGDLTNCTTRINTSSGGAQELIEQVRLYGENASYVGGVTGYNVGYISNDGSGTVSVNSVVSGKKYVGGIVGYNGTAAAGTEKSGKIENYALSGGYISGEAYVGGYAGLNTTENLLGDSNILSANPNEVTADYFAGGVMGALIVVPENNADITVNCATNNFFGSVTAENAFAGGYVGYTQLLKAGENAKGRADTLYDKVTAESISNNIKSEEAEKRQKALQELAETMLDEGQDSDITNTECTFKFASGESSFASVKASVFAGGVIGGNDWNTRLLLENIYNRVRVTGTDCVTYGYISEAKNTKEGIEKQDTFSFAGGIIGLVTPKAEIVSCSNKNAGGVDGNGTYLGGIAEVNLGTIRDCTVHSVSGKSYYGGIAGLNTNDGRIENCELDGQISGESYLGGIVVCNESFIDNCTVGNYSSGNESAVIGTGEYIGGIAAVSRVKSVTVNGGTTFKDNEIKGCSVTSNIGAENQGEAVGGLIGRYEGGTLSYCSVWEGTISGLDRVGGIAGEIYADLDVKAAEDNRRVSNEADIHAVGAAGGVGGYLKEGKSVVRCQNSGTVRSMQEMAGGIVPEVKTGSTVSDCMNSGSVEATRSLAGGITAENNGTIESCAMTDGTTGEPVITGVDAIGGIAGENRGIISECRISGAVTVRDINASGKVREIGGIVGRNTGTISDSVAEVVKEKWPMVTTLSNGSYLGGIAGTNGTDQGEIKGGSLNIKVTLDEDKQGSVGGAAGANGGQISGVTFSGIATGTSGSQYGTGGIAGRNELMDKVGSISDCTLDGSTQGRGIVTAVSRDTSFGGYKETLKGVYVGGICGVNPENGSIVNCSLRGNCEVYGDYGYVGGIVAYNYGRLENSGAETVSAVGTPEIRNAGSAGAACVIGGIVACNDASGVLENCHTGAGWKIENAENVNATQGLFPTGGIIGCNKSVRDQKNLTNYASVNGNHITGGIIGQQFTELRGGFTITNCENHGPVSGAAAGAGGIIADWRYKGGNVRECINYGQVSGGSGTAGGILATGYSSERISITFERCGNEGDIVNSGASSAGGIMGVYNSHGTTLDIIITDCYNAAVIQNTSSGVSAGIFAASNGPNNHLNLTISRCVNYGRGSDPGRNFAGIASKGNADNIVKVQQCLNVGDYSANQTPMVYGYTVTADNYYFGHKSITVNSGATKVAEHDEDSGAFNTDGCSTQFDGNRQRLYLSGNIDDKNGKYLQFTTVNYSYSDGGDNAAIQELKKAFSCEKDSYALLVYGMNSGDFKKPSSVVLEETDNVFKVTYVGDPDVFFCTFGYELEILGRADGSTEWVSLTGIKEIDNPGQNTWPIAENELFAGKDRKQYTELKARVRAVKAAGYDEIDPFTTENGIGYSDWTESVPLTAKPKLPTPRIHFEVTNEGGSGQITGYWVLSNAEDYKEYGTNWEIVIGNVGNISRLNADNLRSPKGQALYSGNRDFTVNAYAEPTGVNNAYSRSDTFVGTLFGRTKDGTLRAVRADDSTGRFTGTKAGDLTYRFRIKQDTSENISATYMAEFWFDGKKIGEGTVLVPHGNAGEECAIDLSFLDQETVRDIIENIAEGDAGKTVEVCFYPWEITDFKYYVTDDQTKEIISRTVPEAAGRTAGSTVFNSSYQHFTLNGMEGYKMYPTPEAGEKVISEIKDDGTIIYTLYWDANAGNNGTITPFGGDDYDDAEYAVTVVGKNGDTEVPLYQGTVKVDENTPPAVTLTENNWKYDQLVLNVERLGKEAVGGSTHYIGASTEKTYNIPIRLSSISKPNAKLRDRNTVVFVVDWVKSGEEGVSGYRIIMTGKKADGSSTRTFTRVVEGKDIVKVEIDLDDPLYEELSKAKEIEFSVVVLSDPDDTGHLDSRESRKEHCEIPERLPAPNATTTLKHSDGTEAAVDIALPPEKFAELRLHLENSGASLEDAAYQIEYFVADANAQAMGGLPADWKQDGGERPGLDPDNGIYISKEPDATTGNLRSAVYILNQPGNPFNAEQAGRILWYRVREVSESKISSVWTKWEKIELPKVLLESVVIAEGQTADRECVYTLNGEAKAEYVITMRQPKLGFTPVPFAKGYAVDITEANRIKYEIDENDGSVIEVPVQGESHSYTLEKVTSPEGESLVRKKGENDFEIAVNSGETSANGEIIWTFAPLYTIDHSYTIQSGSGTFIYKITTSARLCYSTKNGAIQEIWLELPDGVAMDKDGNAVSSKSFIGTATADITVIPPDPDRYVVEKLTRWQRDATDSEKITITEEVVNSASMAVEGYFEDELDMEQLSDQAMQLLGLSRLPEELLPEEELQEETDEEETDPENGDVSGNDVSDSGAAVEQ